MVEQFKNIVEVKGSLISGDVIVTIENGVILDSGEKISGKKNVAFTFKDVLQTPRFQAAPPKEDMPADPNNPTAHLVDPSDPNSAVRQYQPAMPPNRQEAFDARLAQLADVVGEDQRTYLQIKSAWSALILEKESEEQ